MSTFTLEAATRTVMGKGASRRLRRLEKLIPAILYGGDKKPQTLSLSHHKVSKILEDEKIFSSVFDLKLDGKVENVILKDMHRHPFKPIILHMDFQRVSKKDVLVINIPLHFVNESTSKAVKAGGIITHTMTQVEVRCKAKDLPEFIEVDLSDMELDQILHLSDLKLPAQVALTVDLSDGSHNHPVVSAHSPRVAPVEEVVATVEPEETKEAEQSPEQQ